MADEHNEIAHAGYDVAEFNVRIQRSARTVREAKRAKVDVDQWVRSHGVICLATRATANNAALVSPVWNRPFPQPLTGAQRATPLTLTPPPIYLPDQLKKLLTSAIKAYCRDL